jgi:hypothetical protein
MKKIAACTLFLIALGIELTQGQNIDSIKLELAWENATRKNGDKALISVKDNGGIAAKVFDKNLSAFLHD